MPLSSEEYILDVCTELRKNEQTFYLIFCRSVWHMPIADFNLLNSLHVQILFHQIRSDYVQGLLLLGSSPNGVSSNIASFLTDRHTYYCRNKVRHFVFVFTELFSRYVRPTWGSFAPSDGYRQFHPSGYQ